MTPMERIEGELSDAQKRIAELEYLLARQAKAAQQGMDAAKAVASSELEQAKRLHAECNPRALESEREANARLTELVAQLEQERDALAAHLERIIAARNSRRGDTLANICAVIDESTHQKSTANERKPRPRNDLPT